MRRRSRVENQSPLDIIALVVKVLLGVVIGVLLIAGFMGSAPRAGILSGKGAPTPSVGIVAGHWQSDSGAVCPDGLQEVELNLDIARRVAHLLKQQGYRVDVLPEYSPKLNGYQADVFISIHCDACVDHVSGFKVARMTHSAVPEREDRLVETLNKSYAQATGLELDLNTITEDMRQYHALRRIAPETPGAIIECGFMGADRYILTEEADRVAVGIANGLIAFMRQQEATPTPS